MSADDVRVKVSATELDRAHEIAQNTGGWSYEEAALMAWVVLTADDREHWVGETLAAVARAERAEARVAALEAALRWAVDEPNLGALIADKATYEFWRLRILTHAVLSTEDSPDLAPVVRATPTSSGASAEGNEAGPGAETAAEDES